MTRSKITDDGRNTVLHLAGRRGLGRAEDQRIPSSDDNDVSGDSRNPEARDSRNPKKRKRRLIDNSSDNEPEDAVLCEKMDDDEFTSFRTGVVRTGYRLLLRDSSSPKAISQPCNFDFFRLARSAPKEKGVSTDTRIVIHLDDEDDDVAILRQDHDDVAMLPQDNNISMLRETIASTSQSFSAQNTDRVPHLGCEARTNDNVGSEAMTLNSIDNAENRNKSIVKEKTNGWISAESNDGPDHNSSGNRETNAKCAQNEISNGGRISSRTQVNCQKGERRAKSEAASKVHHRRHRPEDESQNGVTKKKNKNAIVPSKSKDGPDRCGGPNVQPPLKLKDKPDHGGDDNNAPGISNAIASDPQQKGERRANSETALKVHHRRSRFPDDESRNGVTKNKNKNAIVPLKSKNGPGDCGGPIVPPPLKLKDKPDHGGDNNNAPRISNAIASDSQQNSEAALKVHRRHRAEDESRNGVTKNKNKNAIVPSKSKNGPYHGGDDNNTPRISNAIASDSHVSGQIVRIKEGPAKQVSKGPLDLRKMLVECILGRGKAPEDIDRVLNEEPENRQSAIAATTTLLPVKFRFEEEGTKQAEKTNDEIVKEGWFAEMDHVWALSELKALDYPEAQVDKNAPANETQHDRCSRGVHELTLRDEEGLVCMYCTHVELGPKEVMPEWAAKTRRGSEKKRKYAAEDIPELNGLDLQPSTTNLAALDYSSIKGTVWEIKAGVRDSMYEHQREGFEFLWKNIAGSISLDDLRSNDEPKDVGGCIISHAPGTGKTRLTIVFIETYLRLFPESRPMIIAPAGMLLTWEEELRKWNVGFPFFNLNNTDTSNVDPAITSKLPKQRRSIESVRVAKLYSWDTRRSVLGISYSLFEKLTWQKPGKKKADPPAEDERFESMRRILFEKPGLVVLDEGHTPRNHRSNIWNVLVQIETQRRVILSGTPFQNNFCELFNTLRIVRPAMAGSLAHERAFSDVIASRKRKKGDRSVQHVELDDRAVERLKLSMSPFVHVHKGTILRKNLPGLRDCVILLKPSALQRSLIEGLQGSPNTLEFEHKLALISVHPHLYLHSDYAKDQTTGFDVRSVEASRLKPNEGAKTRFIMELVHLSNAVGERVLIFSQYIHPLELIKDQLKEVFKWSEGRQILQLQGSLEQKQRQVLINLFNDPKSESKVMLASTKCCSEGISLVGASRVVLLDVLWNPSVERQAICRAYRIGQTKVVYTYHLMTLGTTEADKYCRQAEKERLSELVFTSSSNEGNIEKQSSSAAACIEDRFIGKMVGHPKLKGMFKKIINQPKDVNLIETFGATS